MNWMLFPTATLALVLGIVGYRVGARASGAARVFGILASALLALPAIAYVAYYAHFVDEPIALYSLRAISGSELLASGLGFSAGVLAGALMRRPSAVRRLAATAALAVAALALVLPYAKPLLFPPAWADFRNRWDGSAALQSTPYSCGPATAATLLAARGNKTTERQLAQEAFTSRSGTENWYLARALRRRGLHARFALSDRVLSPAIAGVRGAGYGHFIAVIEHEGDQYTIGDPLVGSRAYTEAQLRDRYEFTGFYLVVE